jgi:monoamine oxidase
MASTYKRITDFITEKALAGADLHLNTAVTHVHYKETPDDSGECVEVRLADGSFAAFDEVVITAPLGWLKLHKDIFSPALPSKLAAAIDNIGWGSLEKAWITFPTAWWHTESDQFPGETLFIRPEYAPDTNPACWNQEVVSLAALEPPFAQPTLMFYLYGENSKMLTGQINHLDPQSDEYYDILNTFFRPYYSRLPNFSATSKTCVPKAFECSNWSHDPWAGFGSYSNFQVGIQHADRDIETYRAGMGEERGIWFAGEATAPFIALGTVTGAYWSGEAVAEKIVARYSTQ